MAKTWFKGKEAAKIFEVASIFPEIINLYSKLFLVRNSSIFVPDLPREISIL
jgi:hypothetical protein